ncbi:MAG: signal peptidase I, partial [Chloroflexota bacterium]
MKNFRRSSGIIANLLLIAGLIAIWLAFAPVKLGGAVSYVMINGVSMEPGLHGGDLVLVRKAPQYQIGDVVTYRDGKIGAYVIHRIIAMEQGHYILKGDNNSWVDAYRPTQEETIGKLWLHLPKLGNAMQWLRSPANLALSIFLLGG